MSKYREALVLSLLVDYFSNGRPTPGTVDSFAQAFDVPRSRMKHLLRAAVKSGLMKKYIAHGEEHYVLDAVEF